MSIITDCSSSPIVLMQHILEIIRVFREKKIIKKYITKLSIYLKKINPTPNKQTKQKPNKQNN